MRFIKEDVEKDYNYLDKKIERFKIDIIEKLKYFFQN